MSGNKKENTELQYEAERDYVKRFIAEQYVSRGYYIHFHRNIEIYGVVKGEVYVTIAGESCTLKEGQIAVINGFESHSYEIDGEAEIFYFHVGTDYVRDFKQLYPNRKLPRWLLERKQNATIISQIKKVMASGGKWSDLKKTGFVCSLFADIIDFYGLISSVPATERGISTYTFVRARKRNLTFPNLRLRVLDIFMSAGIAGSMIEIR